MTPDAYRRLRESIGSQEHVAELLDVGPATIANREKGAHPIRLEAAYALEHLAQLEKRRPSPKVRRLKPTGRGGNGDRKRKADRKAESFARTYHSEARVKFVNALPCIVPLCRGWNYWGCDNAHTVNGGMGRKGPYTSIVPLCKGPNGHHAEQHRIGIQTFASQYDLDLAAEARATEARWRFTEAKAALEQKKPRKP